MVKKSLIALAAAGMLLAASTGAEASWVHYNKKPVTAWQGFQNSANGFVTNVMPWNWFGRKGNSQ